MDKFLIAAAVSIPLSSVGLLLCAGLCYYRMDKPAETEGEATEVGAFVNKDCLQAGLGQQYPAGTAEAGSMAHRPSGASAPEQATSATSMLMLCDGAKFGDDQHAEHMVLEELEDDMNFEVHRVMENRPGTSDERKILKSPNIVYQDPMDDCVQAVNRGSGISDEREGREEEEEEVIDMNWVTDPGPTGAKTSSSTANHSPADFSDRAKLFCLDIVDEDQVLPGQINN